MWCKFRHCILWVPVRRVFSMQPFQLLIEAIANNHLDPLCWKHTGFPHDEVRQVNFTRAPRYLCSREIDATITQHKDIYTIRPIECGYLIITPFQKPFYPIPKSWALLWLCCYNSIHSSFVTCTSSGTRALVMLGADVILSTGLYLSMYSIFSCLYCPI